MKFRNIAAVLLLALTSAANAQWSTNSSVNTPVVTATGTQSAYAFISDGASGTYVTWQDGRTGTYDIYVQHFNREGRELWTPGGINICSAAADQETPALCSDGANGIFVVWSDRRNMGNYDLYAQRLNNAGVPQWTANGVAVCNAALDQTLPKILIGATNSAAIVWCDTRNGGGNSDIYAQLINGSGVEQWTSNGEVICNATGNQNAPAIISNSGTNIVVAWEDYRSGSTSDIYAQRFNSTGTMTWAANGVPVSVAALQQSEIKLATDLSGNIFFGWTDMRNGNLNLDIYCQKLTSAGVAQWTTDGVVVCSATGYQEGPGIGHDGSGGVTLVWSDRRSGTNNDIYMQNLNSSGVPTLTANGIAVCTAPGNQVNPRMIASNGVGVFVTWADARGSNADIYAQYYYITGVAQWATDGILISSASGNQSAPIIVAKSSAAIIMWTDTRNGNNDIYIQNVCSSGLLGTPAPTDVTAPALLNICSGSSTTLSASGTGTIGWYTSPVGGPPLTYGGTYTTPVLTSTATYYVQDSNSCAASARTPIQIVVHPNPTVALGSDTTQCGGTVVLDAGNPGATYSWSNSGSTQTIIASTTGTYSVTVSDSNGCTGTDAINVDINTVPTVNLGNDTALCGTLLIDAGNLGATYFWSDSTSNQIITVNTSGTYSVIVTTADGCTNSDAITVTSYAVPQVNLGSDTVLCGGNIMLDAQNQSTQITWNTGDTTQIITVTASGVYVVSVTSLDGCSSVDSITVTINTVNIGVTQTWNSLTANAAAATYQWIDCANGNVPVVGETGQSFVATVNGDYAVIVTENNCTDTSNCLTVNDVSVSEIQTNVAFNIFPNPGDGIFQMNVIETGDVIVYNATGAIVKSEKVREGTNALDLRALNAGVYFVRYSYNSGVSTQKIIIQR
jgi:Ig-like domain CHU_C associated/Secretion system C-terminal sorting domain